MAHIRRHHDPSIKAFLKRTVSAQLHLLGTIAASVGLGVLIHYARMKGDTDHLWACLIFGVTGILVFAVSTVYHFMADGYKISAKLHGFMEDLDHFAIFLFIAGSYTPFLINVINPPWRAILMVMIWAIGSLGILYTRIKPKLPRWAQHRFVYTSIFLLMGWTLVIRIDEAFRALTSMGVFLLLAGALCYSIGAVFYATKRPNLIKDLFGFHELWHVMVLLGFGFHYFLILNFYLVS